MTFHKLLFTPLAFAMLLLPGRLPAQTQLEEHTPPDGPFYPGAPKSTSRLQGAVGDYIFRLYGTVLLNISMSDAIVVGQEVPLWAFPANINVTFSDGTQRRSGAVGDTIFTARQSILGVQVSPKTMGSGWNASGLIEMDFFGSRPVDTIAQAQNRFFNQPRLRRGYLQLDKGDWRIVAGQDKVILAPLDPISLSHVAIPLGATAGNLWAWLPQVRVENRHKFGDTTLLVQGGIVAPSFGDSGLTDQAGINGSAVDFSFSGNGSRGRQPFYQARVALSHPMAGRTATAGVSGHYGRERIGANRDIDSAALAVDVSLPIFSKLIFRGEGFVGSNLSAFDGGVLQGVGRIAPVAAGGVVTTPGVFRKIRSRGGWAELISPVTSKDIFYVGAGTDDPLDTTLLPNANRSKNSFAWASYFRKLTSDVTLAAEWSFWDFQTRSITGTTLGPRLTSGRGNVVNIALAYQF
jgi:hypothetical protein